MSLLDRRGDESDAAVQEAEDAVRYLDDSQLSGRAIRVEKVPQPLPLHTLKTHLNHSSTLNPPGPIPCGSHYPTALTMLLVTATHADHRPVAAA